MPKYDETENILSLYMHAAGVSEIPTTWHKWSCLTLVAAALSDRVFYRKFPWENLAPNMYTMLIGPSGCGKGGAIGFGMQFKHPRMNLLYGSTTKQSLIDRMITPVDDPDMVSNSKVFIVQAELGQAVGTGQLADAYIKAMTDWYNPSPLEIEENTRTHGKKIVEDPPCLNWLSGTTNEWLRDAVDYKAMMSGFFGRVCTIPGHYDFDTRVYSPPIVRDYDQVVAYLKDRFEELTRVEGEFGMLPAAMEIDRDWYEKRSSPSQGMEPFWRREHDLILKLSMILSACEALDRTIAPRHVVAAQELVREVRAYMPEVIEHAARGGVTTGTERIKQKIYEHTAGITRSQLLRFMARFGTKARELDDMLNHLIDQECIESKKALGKTWYARKSPPAIQWENVKE